MEKVRFYRMLCVCLDFEDEKKPVFSPAIPYTDDRGRLLIDLCY